MKKLLMYLIVLSSLMCFSVYSAEKKSDRETYESRYQDISAPVRGHYAKSCVIDGEVYFTNDHKDLENICTQSKGKLVKVSEGEKIAKKANKIHSICCVDESTNRKSFVLARGDKETASCGEAGKQAENKNVCFKAKAGIFNAYKIKAEYKADPINKAGASLDAYINEYEAAFTCSNNSDKKKKVKKASIDKKISDFFRMGNKKLGQGRVEEAKDLGDRAPMGNDALPVCCQTASGFKTVANECACILEPSQHAEVVPATANTCEDLAKSYDSLSELKVNFNHNYLDQKTSLFMEDKSCFAHETGASLSLPKSCIKDSDGPISFYNLECTDKNKKLSSTTIICHNPLANNQFFGGEDDNKADVSALTFDEIKELECHMSETL